MEKVYIHDKAFRPLMTALTIQDRIEKMAGELNGLYAGKEVVLLPVLSGAFLFAADLCRHLSFGPEVEFVKLSSYGKGMASSGTIRAVLPPPANLEGRHVIIVEDIVDSGLTSDYLREELAACKPDSVAMASLLYKPDSFRGQTPPEFTGFVIPPAFVIGYGLDYNGKGRELNAIYVLDEA